MSAIVELSFFMLKASEWFSVSIAAPLLLLFHSASASMTYCFKDLIMLHLTLSLLLMMFREMQLLSVFVREAGHFSLMFSISFSLSVDMTDAF